jgi:RNase P/RNase MRP subunit p29
MESRDRPLDGRDVLAGELLGASLRITAHPGLANLPVEGVLVDETLETFLLRRPGHAQCLRIPKSGAVGTILLGERELPLSGEVLRVRPEDRTKRLLGRGRRSVP